MSANINIIFVKGSELHTLPINKDNYIINYDAIKYKLTSKDVYKFPPDDVTISFYLKIVLIKTVCAILKSYENKHVVIYYTVRQSSEHIIETIAKNINNLLKSLNIDISYTCYI